METHMPYGIYEKYIKRPLDFCLALVALVLLSPLLILISLLVRIHLGSPVIFRQSRPGRIDPRMGRERIFCLYKFRSMNDARNERGELLPDEQRLSAFGKWLRSTSMDELPELINILKGDMAIVGPRPQLVRDMVFMNANQRKRHTVRQGLTGLAQVKGRNAISWEEKIAWDIKYLNHITFIEDVKIIGLTIRNLFRPHPGVTGRECDIAPDYGDYLLESGKISDQEYSRLQAYAKRLLSETGRL